MGGRGCECGRGRVGVDVLGWVVDADDGGVWLESGFESKCSEGRSVTVSGAALAGGGGGVAGGAFSGWSVMGAGDDGPDPESEVGLASELGSREAVDVSDWAVSGIADGVESELEFEPASEPGDSDATRVATRFRTVVVSAILRRRSGSLGLGDMDERWALLYGQGGER